MAKKNLIPAINKIINRYRQTMMAQGIPVQKLILFGSYAKNNATTASDIDLCIVSPIFGKSRFDERVRLSQIATQVSDLLEPHPYNLTDLNNQWDPLAVEIKKYGIVV